ncbi:unnamed protein product [Cyprideis torosa]|uniref:histidine kinase n=1 Tax=Cyprideis torosa TaxID=163714 RepID=A0A7R8WM05_9CRUS|nr:unnamed protein product [Cyprideis torosa]CAG0897880.1 unnamed protein product [Cyprideis torosa]
MQIEDEEILQGFIEESLEHLSDIEQDLLSIEKGGLDIDENLVNKVFRAAHSIKGGAGFMGLDTIQELSHCMENVLGLIRSKKIAPTQETINILLQSSDKLQDLIENIETSNDQDISTLIAPLNAAATTTKTEATSLELSDKKSVSDTEEKKKTSPGKEQSQPDGKIELTTSQEKSAQSTKRASGDKENNRTPQQDTSLRVHVSLLDQLMNLAGELVLSRNQLLQTIGTDDLRSAETVGQRIDLITSELQEAIMLTRMQPIGNVFNKFPRVVRDLAKKLGKQVCLEIIGKDVELDKTIIESISDPLTHLVRNSIDHGIEGGQERIAKGKGETGKVQLKAYHEAGQVVIEIRDDGKGIDGEALAASAIAKGLISVDQAQMMSANEKVHLIFLPGFSTAQEVTDVSGRGVGMDVVKTNLDKLGGAVDIVSEKGQGTTISIKLPLTLAIIPCQIVICGGERYAIPQVNLEELLRIPASQVKDRIEMVGKAEVVRLRGTLLPLIRLADLLGVKRFYQDAEDMPQLPDRRERIADRRSRQSQIACNTKEFDQIDVSLPEAYPIDREDEDRRYRASSALNIVVVSTGVMKYGLIVDGLHDSEEIVIKPLGRHLQQCLGYAGATIMGDGRIALILDVGNLARMAKLTSVDGSERAGDLAALMAQTIQAQKDKQSLLVFHAAGVEQYAVPLNQVERIEKIKSADIEQVGNKKVMQYRNGSLSLLTLEQSAQGSSLEEQEDLLVIVFQISKRLIGLLATGPIDAIEVATEIDDRTLKQKGIMGSTIIDGQTTLLVNIFELVHETYPDWNETQQKYETSMAQYDAPPTLLIAEDSNFFRNQVTGYIREGGYEVLEAVDGQHAWELLLEQGEDISLVVTDIEMPNLDGFALTERIRADDRFKNKPVIALTTLTGEENVARGKEAGIDEYHIKLDKESLMASVHQYINKMHTQPERARH